MIPKGERPSLVLLAVAICLAILFGALPASGDDFHFDSSISRPVLENYLDRSISFTELLHDDLNQPRNKRGVDPHDNVRFLLGSRAKFVGRALMLWGREGNLPAFLRTAKPYALALHKADPEIILQAAAFEIVTRGVESIPVPEPVFAEYGLPVESRNFRYRDMLYTNGRFVNHWGGNGSVPDMSRIETRMWFYFLATSYIDAGIEAIHFGQVGLMDKNDPNHAHWIDLLGRARAFAQARPAAFLALRRPHPDRRLRGRWQIALRFPFLSATDRRGAGPAVSRCPQGRLFRRHLLAEQRGRHPERLVVRAPALSGRIRQLRPEQPRQAQQAAVCLGLG